MPTPASYSHGVFLEGTASGGRFGGEASVISEGYPKKAEKCLVGCGRRHHVAAMVGEDPPISGVLWWVFAVLDHTLRLSG